MDRTQVLEAIRNGGIVPAIRVETERQALDALGALLEGGISLAEIALSTPGSIAFLKSAVARFESTMILGAGSVLDAETARISILEGAQFIVSPVFDPGTIQICRRYNIAVLPGALTPTEILAAWTMGADIVKVFPANAMGGPGYIRAVKAPMPQVELMPMGGVTLENAAAYLKSGAATLGVGSDLVSMRAPRDESIREITAKARCYHQRIREARRT
jgi:2-dehydro-3-deoxyphosphogluconate aldolase/(4S)-4-hydroxy-2-oxoglutarate aldolase